MAFVCSASAFALIGLPCYLPGNLSYTWHYHGSWMGMDVACNEKESDTAPVTGVYIYMYVHVYLYPIAMATDTILVGN